MTTVVHDRVEPHVSMLTLNRPERLNALDFDMVRDLHDALDEIGGDPECRVVVLTGSGRGFCAGLDLKEYGTPPAPGEHRHAHVGVGGQELMSNLTVHMRTTPQIIIAAVNGAAFGGGLALACAADLRHAGESARFCSAFIRTGLTGTDIGISYLLPQIIGAGRAFDLIITGRDIDAAEAEHLGLVTTVAPDATLLDDALATARTIAGYTSTGLVMTKEVFWHNASNPSMAAAIAIENRNQAIAARTPEVQEFMARYSAEKVQGKG